MQDYWVELVRDYNMMVVQECMVGKVAFRLCWLYRGEIGVSWGTNG